MFLNEILSSIDDNHDNKGDLAAAGATAIGRKITKTVNQWTAHNNLDGTVGTYQVPAVNSALDEHTLESIGVEAIDALVKSCDITSGSLQAKKLVAIDIAKNAVCSGPDIMSLQNMMDPMNSEVQFTDPGTLSFFPSSVPDAHAFGSDIDKVSSDLRLTLSVDIMSFHNRIAHRLMHVKPTPDAIIRYRKVKAVVFNNQDMDAATMELVDLYEDASIVSPTLPKVIPRTANGAPEEGYIEPGSDDLFKLSIDASKPGYSSYNRQDTIADGAFIDKVKWEIGPDAAGRSDMIYTVGKARGKLGFTTNSEASMRTLFFETDIIVDKTTEDASGTAAAAFAGIHADDQLVIKLTLTVRLHLRTGDINTTGSVAAVKVEKKGGGIAQPSSTTALEAIQTGVAFTKISSYAIDARFSEENLRKSSIEIEAIHSELAYNLPTGVNYFYSEPLMGKKKDDRAVELLTSIIGIGQDKKVAGEIEQVLNDITSAITVTDDSYSHNGAGTSYAAGSLVRPFVYTGNIDCNDFKTHEISNLPYDVKQFVMTTIGNVLDRIHATSFFPQQLAGRAPTYKVLTSGDIISKLFSQPRMAIAGQPDKSTTLEGGSSYRLELPNGAIIELHASTQAEHADKIIGIPYVSDPNSELNFGANWTFGIAVAHYVKTGAAVAKRIVANSREAFIPTNPLGFLLSVRNLDDILSNYKD